ncbi:hypothetical protein SAMN05192574_101840 [Mucilaginibacter gossypiicola]|uniref:Glycosyltransferase involved in LPS biosynthesis, GR25 family n=1 Tax=Mucilaginibacter gossypiicola TaxID=551995 RepID=A0A1H8B9K8_9SPHI|nr:hypothetical protein [Mucilaginibacter gossypiicola]SEM79641.1 hypothetical protein SAMN05192574_101840 [Mucilaginibacter gossypiicola]
MKIKTFAINLRKRPDRRGSVLEQFDRKPEFDLSLVEGYEHPIGAMGLWITIRQIILNCMDRQDEYILICEDDHEFTDQYSLEYLASSIALVSEFDGDLLAGGVSCVKSTIQVRPGLYWMEQFTGFQFVIIFRRLFRSIIEFNFKEGDDADIVVSDIARNKFLLHPFISVQKEFGYSDVTHKNARMGHVHQLFAKSSERISDLNTVDAFYNGKSIEFEYNEEHLYEGISIPTFIIGCSDSLPLKEVIFREFKDKPEFDLKFITDPIAGKPDSAFVASIGHILRSVSLSDEDIVIICNSGHRFTADYARGKFINNIIEAHQQGVGLLLGGISGFDSAVPVCETRFWISSFQDAGFIVVYNKLFEKILSESFNNQPSINHPLSEITSHKMVMYPFISVPSGLSDEKNESSARADIAPLYELSSNRLSYIQAAKGFISLYKQKRESPRLINP